MASFRVLNGDVVREVDPAFSSHMPGEKDPISAFLDPSLILYEKLPGQRVSTDPRMTPAGVRSDDPGEPRGSPHERRTGRLGFDLPRHHPVELLDRPAEDAELLQQVLLVPG